jgi:hypothetical protein
MLGDKLPGSISVVYDLFTRNTDDDSRSNLPATNVEILPLKPTLMVIPTMVIY